jgi:hypothetical protein
VVPEELVSAPIRGVPEYTHGVDIVALRGSGLLAIGPDGQVWMIVRRGGVWVLYLVSVAIRSQVIWTAYTRRGCLGVLLGRYNPLG